MTHNEGLAGWLRLTLTPGIGGETQRKLLAAFGLPEAVFAAGRLAVRAVAGERADALFDFDAGAAIDRSIEWAQQPGQHIVTLGDAEYPASLFEIPDPPTVLYVRGNPALLGRRGLAIVGSRNATPQGMQTAEAFARALAGKGLAIVSVWRWASMPPPTAVHWPQAATPSRSSAPAPTASIRPATAIWRWPSPGVAPSSPSSRSARRPSPPTSRGATASSPDWRAASWWSKPPQKAAP